MSMRPAEPFISVAASAILMEATMASTKQKAAARKNIKKAAKAAKAKRTISKLPARTRTALGKEGAKAAKRKKR